MSEPTTLALALDGREDFDFFMGAWNVHHRKLRARLKGSTDWEEFDGETESRKVLGGLGNTDQLVMDSSAGHVVGMTVRLFDPHTRQWRIYWADSVHGAFDQPMIGRFQNGRGEFYAQEFFEGQSIYSRFIWTSISETECRWEQAFSADGGKTWETNWIMDFTRRDASHASDAR
ncbi:MAG TPA: hypothetical protein VF812_15625 [Ktedonobacterales bacterium]